jgi:hypothetical protein
MCVSYFSSPIHGKNKPDDFRDEATLARETRTSRKGMNAHDLSDLLSSKGVNKGGLHLESWISRAAGKEQQHGTIPCLSKAKPPLRRLCIQQGHLVRENLTPVVISIVIAIPVTAGLELSTLAQITIAGQDLPFVRSAGLQPSQLKRVVVTSTLMVGGPPGLIATRHAIADMVGTGGTGGPVDGGRVTCNVVDSWAVNNADGSFVGGVHGSLRECDCRHQRQQTG